MYACPSCQQRTISYLHKWLSWSSSPARCKACGKACAIPIVDSSGFFVAAIVIVTLSGFASVWMQNSFPLLLGCVSALAYYFWRQHVAELAAVSEQEHKTAKRSAWLALLAALFPSFFN